MLSQLSYTPFSLVLLLPTTAVIVFFTVFYLVLSSLDPRVLVLSGA